MAQKIVNARIMLKHDTEENWKKATGFIPRASEPIIYDEDDAHPYKRYKIGDGERNVNNLPFTLKDNNVHYYDLLSIAANDIANKTWDHELINPDLGKVKVIEKEDRFEVILFAPIEEVNNITFTKDVDLILNEQLNSSATIVLEFTSTVKFATINGKSIIQHTVPSTAPAGTYQIIKSAAQKLIINGGQYEGNNECENAKYITIGISEASGKIIEIYGANISATSTSTLQYLRGVQGGEGLIIKDSSISVIGAQTVRGVLVYGETAEIINCNIYAETSSIDSKTALGIYTASTNNKLFVKDSVINTDAPGYSFQDTKGVSQGISPETNTVLYCENCDVFGTHSAVRIGNDTYVKGGHYKSNGHGGFYFGASNVVYYINDAIIENTPYEGKFTDLMPDVSRLGALYIGGGEDNNNITAHLDGCQIIGNSAASIFVMRGTSNEQNNTINISNSIVTGENQIRIDNETLKLNIGEGTNITVDMIDNPACAEFTNKNYRYVGKDNLVYGEDYNNLKDYCDKHFNSLGSNEAVIDVLALPTENVNTNIFYRLEKGVFLENQLKLSTWNCIVVDTLPTTGNVVTTDMKTVTAYYNKADDTAYGYVNSALAAQAGVTAGWYPLANLAPMFGLTFAGVITNINDDPRDGAYRLILEQELYTYDVNGWTLHKSMGQQGTGDSAEIFNHPSNIASGIASHAEGQQTEATGNHAHAEGLLTKAKGKRAHAEGLKTVASGDYAHAEGEETNATLNAAHAEGYGTTASGYYAHAEGERTKATGNYTHSEGIDSEAHGVASHVEGWGTTATGEVVTRSELDIYDEYYSYDNLGANHAEGFKTEATGAYSHAEGYKSKANRKAAHAEGWNTFAGYSSDYNYPDDDTSRGEFAHAEGEGTQAINYSAHAEGHDNIAAGTASHVGGEHSEAKGLRSFAHGAYVNAKEADQVVFGKFNADNANALFVVGNGTEESNRKNAFEVISNTTECSIKVGNTIITEEFLRKLLETQKVYSKVLIDKSARTDLAYPLYSSVSSQGLLAYYNSNSVDFYSNYDGNYDEIYFGFRRNENNIEFYGKNPGISIWTAYSTAGTDIVLSVNNMGTILYHILDDKQCIVDSGELMAIYNGKVAGQEGMIEAHFVNNLPTGFTIKP